ncbi:MAG: glycosyltransferase family 9 protein [Verrucomicrobiae bacterium]|nr:glycosyltransferase family 9 protein [Verrucomicrobiae bacterium]
MIVLASGLGDTLMFTPALRILREAWPRARLSALVVREGEREALECNRDLDEVRFVPFLRLGLSEVVRKILALRREKFDLVLLPCPGNRIHYNLLARLTGAPHRAAFRYLQQSRFNLDFLNTLLVSHRDDVHNAEHNLLLVERVTGFRRGEIRAGYPPINLPTTEADREAAARLLTEQGAMAEGWIGLHLSSSRVKEMHRKCWPVEHFVSLAQKLVESHPGLGFLVFCGADDEMESRQFLEKLGDRARLVRQLPVRVVAEAMRRCRAVVTNDSGLLHVAVAVNTPTVTIFGPTNPRRSGAWGGRATVVRRDLSCSPCFYHTSRDLECLAGLDFACLRELSVAEVTAAVEKTLRQGTGFGNSERRRSSEL